MCEVCCDNRLKLIEEFKGKLVDGTNIETAPEEMAVLDNILFRIWQMGWLDKLKAQEPVKPILKREGWNKHHNDYACPICKAEITYEQNYCSECGRAMAWE